MMRGRLVHVIPQDLKIEEASIFDLGKILEMAFDYHKDDPIFQAILSNPIKSFAYRIFGPLYMALKYNNYKATILGKLVGYVLLKCHKSSVNIEDIGVHPSFRRLGIGTELIKSAESFAYGKYLYVTLWVMENNTTALNLYKKLGYRDLQDSRVCFKLKKFPFSTEARRDVILKSVSGDEAVSCRNKYYLDIVESTSGSEGREIALEVHLSSRLSKKVERFRIIIDDESVGYVAIQHRKGSVSIFFLLSPNFGGAYAEKAILERIIEQASKKPKGAIAICVLQAYEKSLTKTLNKMDSISERRISRLGLIKKLDIIR